MNSYSNTKARTLWHVPFVVVTMTLLYLLQGCGQPEPGESVNDEIAVVPQQNPTDAGEIGAEADQHENVGTDNTDADSDSTDSEPDASPNASDDPNSDAVEDSGGNTTEDNGNTTATDSSPSVEPVLPSSGATQDRSSSALQLPSTTYPLPRVLPLPEQPQPPVTEIADNAPQLAPETSVPGTTDPASNPPPYFEGLTDQRVLAGDTLVLRVVPRDADRTVPGLFTGPLPEGAQFSDNLDGTKSLIWRPLQPDVGTHEVSITAVDASVPLYRTTQVIRIRVALPEDPSQIVNIGPSINEVKPHTARAGDTVRILVKATDPNGTLPALEVLNPPLGSSFERLPEDDNTKVLTWPTRVTDVGEHRLDFRAIDAADPQLDWTRTIVITLADTADFIRPGERLRDLADRQQLKMGYANLLAWYSRPDGELYAETAAEEFSIMTTENSVKWGVVNPQPNRWEWEAFDREVQLAHLSGMLVHGHPLVWHRQLPGWVQRLPEHQRERVMLDFIRTVAARYPEHIAVWDVVNESLEADGSFRESAWFEAMGSSYISKAFFAAREAAPAATLLYNDFDVAWGGPKSDAMLALMQSLLAAGAPVDGVGFQLHVDSGFGQFDNVRNTLQRFANLGLSVHVTELDVFQRNGDTEETQAAVYAELLSICLEQPACLSFQTWGFTDRYTWIRERTPLLMTPEYQPKPAYFALQRVLRQYQPQ